jgi:protoporphyrin/coproporphyrin ferrochelatase
MSEPTGVLLMAYGTPLTLADIEAYYTHIRRGRPPSPEMLEALTERYRAIGGASPLLAICRAQAEGLERLLGSRDGRDFRVQLGMKHAAPFIEDGVEALVDAGVRRAVALALAPHYSALSVGEYMARARDAAGPRIDLFPVEHWHLTPSYVALLAERVRSCLRSFPADARPDIDLVVTAHSLPTRILESDDPYPMQLRQTAQAVARQSGMKRWSVAWQSAGRTPEPWLGPDVLEVVRELGEAGSRGAIVCPAGFVSDHLEILYDLDLECRAAAVQADIPWRRTASPNADPEFLAALGDVVLDRLAIAA